MSTVTVAFLIIWADWLVPDGRIIFEFLCGTSFPILAYKCFKYRTGIPDPCELTESFHNDGGWGRLEDEGHNVIFQFVRKKHLYT